MTVRAGRLDVIALTQHLVLSRQQLKSLGWTHNRIEHEIRVGRWSAVAPQVVALQNAPLDRPQTCWLGVLHAGPDSALSHATGSELADLTWTVDPVVHVLTRRGDVVADLPGLWFHQTRRPFGDWLRHGSAFRLALGDIAGGAHSFAEIDIGRICREAGLPPPDRQRIRRDGQGRRRYLDCEWVLRDGRVIVLEVDGSFHMRTTNWWRDMERERAVVISGRSVLRCSSVEIRLEPEGIVADLRAIGVPAGSDRFVSDRTA